MEESKSPLDTDNTKSSMVSLNKSIMDSEDKGQLVEGKDDVPTTLERFWILFLFCCCIMVNQCGWIQIAPVFLLVEDLYGASSLTVNLMSYSFMALYLPMNYPWTYVVEKNGLRVGVIGGILSTTAGLWVRCFINQNFYTVLAGQVIMALGQPLLYNSPALVTSNWFPQKERPMATMAGTQAGVFGIFFGYLLPSLFVNSYSDPSQLTTESREVYESQMFNMLVAVSCFGTVISILVILTFREKPGSPLLSKKTDTDTSKDALIDHIETNSSEKQALSMGQQLKLCAANKKFVLTSIGTCCVILHFYVFTTVVGQLVLPYGIDDSNFVTDMGLFVFGFGVVGGVSFSLALTYRPDKMKIAAFFIAFSSIATLAFFMIATMNGDRTQILIACGLLGFFLLPILFVAYEIAVEQTAASGVGETISCGLINVVANFVGFLLAIGLSPVIGKETKASTTVCFIVLFANLGVSILFLTLGEFVASDEQKKTHPKSIISQTSDMTTE